MIEHGHPIQEAQHDSCVPAYRMRTRVQRVQNTFTSNLSPRKVDLIAG